MKKIYRLSLLSIILGLLTSCDPWASDLYYIDNLSDYELNVYYKDYWSNDSLITISSKDKLLIYRDGDLGVAEDRGDDFLYWADTLLITINDSMTIEKDYLNRVNWTFKITGGEEKYTLVVENEDVVSVE